MKEKEKIRAEIERLAQLHLEMLEGYRADGNISAAAIENVLYGHDLSILSFIDSLQEEPVDKCKGCNNVKGCITCVDGDQWAHYEEPVSEGLEEASKEWLRPQLDKSYVNYGEVKMMEFSHFDGYDMLDAIEYGMRLQKEQMMSKAIDVTVHIEAGNYPYIPQMELYDYDKDIPLAKEGDKYKVVLIKED